MMLSSLTKRELTFLESEYLLKIVPLLIEKFDIPNPHMVPCIDKIVVSMRFGKDAGDKKAIESAIQELSLITGRKPAISKARAAIAGFKLRKDQISGAYCTLRGQSCFWFLEKMIYLALPVIRDFRGFSPSAFDKKFNFSFGISEHLIFPELTYDSIYKSRGLDVVIVIKNASSKAHALTLLQSMNFPIKS